MPVILGNASRPSFDAAGAMLQNKQIETQKAIALAQIRAANARAAMGMAENAMGMANANSQRDQDRAAQERARQQQQAMAQRNAQITRGNKLAQDVARENQKWRDFINQWKLKGMTHSPDQMMDLMEVDRELNDLIDKYNKAVRGNDHTVADALLGEMLNVQQKRWKHQPETVIPKQIEEIDGQKFVRDANGNLREIGISAEKLNDARNKANADHALKVKHEAAENVERAVKLFDLLWKGGTDWNTSADSAFKAHGTDPVGGIRKMPNEDGYKFLSPASANADWAKEKYFIDKKADFEKEIRDANRKAGVAGESLPYPDEKAAVDKLYQPYESLEQKWRASQPGSQQPQVSQQQSVEPSIPQAVQEALDYIQKVTDWVTPSKEYPNGRTIPAAQLEITKKALSESNAIVKKYQTENGIATEPAAQAPAQPAAQQPAPQQAPQAQEQPAAPAKKAGPFSGKIISSMGGGGMGGTLAMGSSLSGLASGAWDSMTKPSTARSASLATGPNASTDGDKVDRLDGFRQRMEAWVKRNPIPSTQGLYQPVKDGNSRDFTNKPLYKGGALGPAKFPMTAAEFTARQEAERAQQEQLDLEAGVGGSGSTAGPGLASPSWSNGPGATRGVGPALDPKAYQQALNELAQWEKANPGKDVSSFRQALSESLQRGDRNLQLNRGYKSLNAIDAKTGNVPGGIGSQANAPTPGLHRGGIPSHLTPEALKQASDQIDKAISEGVAPKNLSQGAKDLLSRNKQVVEFEREFAKTLARNGASVETSIKAAQQLSRLDKIALKTLSGLGTLSRIMGHVGNALTALGWAGSILQTPSKHLDNRVRDWAAQRMAAENGLADAFGISRAEARTLSNSIDGYLKGVKPSHLKELRGRADSIVPPEKTAASPSAPSNYKPGKQKVEMDLSPFAFVNERDLRQKAIQQYSELWDKLSNTSSQRQGDKALEERSQELQRSWDDFEKYSWPQFKSEISDLAKEFAKGKGGAPTQANQNMKSFGKEVDDLGNWQRPQPTWSSPEGVTPNEWKSIQSRIGREGTESFFGSHIDKPGSYLRQGGEQRYSPGDLRQQSSENQIKVDRTEDGELKLTSGSGKEMYPTRSGLPQQLPGTTTGSRAFDQAHLEEMGLTPKEAAKQEQERNAVTIYGLSGNGELPKKPDGGNVADAKAEAFQKTSELSQNLQTLSDEGWLSFDVKQQFENYPDGVEKLPAAKWTGKDGKQHTRNDIPTSPAGLRQFIDDVEKSKGVGKHSEEWKAAEAEAKQAAEQAKYQPRPLPEQIGPDHGQHLSPQAQEAHLRSPKPASRQEFGEAYKEKFGGDATDEDYQNYLDAREAVRSQLPKSAGDTAPGNLYLDPKTGELKQNDGAKGRKVPDDEPLPRGYDQTVPLPKAEQLGGPRGRQPVPREQQIQGGMNAEEIRQGHAAARAKQAAEDAVNPLKQKLDRMGPIPDGRGAMPPIQKRLAPRPIDRRDFQVPPAGMPAGAGVQGRASYTPTFDDFSSQGQFAQSLNLGQRQLPDYNNATAMNPLGNTYWPQQETPQYMPQQQYQPSYASPQYEQPLSFYEPQYSQPSFDYMPQSFDFQPSYNPVGPSYDFGYQNANLGSFSNYYGDSGNYYGGGYSDGLSDYSGYA